MEFRMRLIASVLLLCFAAVPALAQEGGPRLRQPRAAPLAAKATPKPADTGAFACTATRVRVSNLASKGPSPVALPALYARPFSGACAEAEKRAKAIPSQDTNFVILGRTTPVEMAAGLCQSGAGNRTFPRDDLKATRGGFVRPATNAVKETVTITSGNKYTLTGTGSGFSYTLSGTCTVMQPAT
jgi:hypothetical protein